MSVKIRLQRHGRKKSAFFHVVVADSRAPRNGRFIEKLGTYNPNTNPATIDLNFDSTLNWLQNGAVPTDTCRAILSYKGIMMKHHLLNGVKKGAHTEEQAEEKFQSWLKEKTDKVESKKSGLTEAQEAKRKADFEREAKISQERAAKIAERNAPPAEETEAPAEEGEEATAEAATEETATAETEAPATEEVKEEPKAEETPAEEPKAEEAKEEEK